MGPDVRAHAGQAAINVGERPPKVIEHTARAFRKNDIAPAAARPHLGTCLAQHEIAADIQHQEGEE